MHATRPPHVPSLDAYRRLYDESVGTPAQRAAFWSRQARALLSWQRDFHDFALHGVDAPGFAHAANVAYFLGGQLNAAYNCVDRWALATPNETAILWEGDDPHEHRRWSYAELLTHVCQIANALRELGVKKGDTVVLYMPMVPETAATMLACARLGALHSVVFAGFSADALRHRIIDARASLVVTANEGLRGGRRLPLKKTVDEALLGCELVTKTLVLRRTDGKVPMHPSRDVDFRELVSRQRAYCPPVTVDSEDPLFTLYTSGSTGKPKGIMHTTAGYLLYAALTFKYVFDYQHGGAASPGGGRETSRDVFGCVADVGWITGHSYIVYGPLCNGATTFMFEGVPDFPDASRYWAMVERFRITHLYTAPTALRALMRHGDAPVQKHDLSSLRVLGSVGEPINPAAWEWYYRVVGREKCAIVDTYWQTETGGHIIASLPGAMPMKPGSASLPFFGIEPVIVDAASGKPVAPDADGNREGVLALASAWPGMARTILGDHKRYVDAYFHVYKNLFFTGDGARIDSDGYVWITGRVDDVIKKAGHRLSTADIEGALVMNAACSEAAVVAIPDELKGEAIFAYCVVREAYLPRADVSADEAEKMLAEIAASLRVEVRTHIGAIASPDFVLLVPGLPKTRSGKVMRRLLRKIATRDTDEESLGDVSTLADPSIVDEIIARSKKLLGEAPAK